MKCLIVGRTPEDVAECKAYGLASHGPVCDYKDYNTFNGDVISCHTIKPWSDLACTVEVSERVIDSARKHPVKIIVGMSEYHKVSEDHELFDTAIIYNKGDRHPSSNSGVFAMWWALQNYDEIYTLGINLVGDTELLSQVRKMFDKYPGKKIYKASKESRLPCEVKSW